MFRRRDFLMTMSALPWLPGLLRGAPLLQKSNRSLIVLWMDGGMSHIDTFDGKPEARPDIRGELVSRESSLESVFVSEHLPRLAGIMAAKRTAELIPLCHPIPLSAVTIDFTLHDDGVTVTATARTAGQTGVEMEALTAATAALLTVYDMAKALDKGMIIGDVRLLAKRGGKSGDWAAPESSDR